MTRSATHHRPSSDRWTGVGLPRWYSAIPLIGGALVVLAPTVGSTGGSAAGTQAALAGSLLGVLVMGVAWVVLPEPFGFAVATVTALALLGDGTLGAPFVPVLVLQAVTALLLVVALVLETTDPDRVLPDGILALAVFGALLLVVRPSLVSGDGYGRAAAVLASGTAVLSYGLHRYALVRTGEVAHGD